MTSAELAALLGDWSGRGSGGITQRLAVALVHLVESGVLREGDRLPPERELAAVLAVSRPTVRTAVARLREQGLVDARQGSGSWVRPVPARPVGTTLAEAALRRAGINLAASVPADAGDLPDLRLGLDDLLATDPAHGYDVRGLRTLRSAIAQRAGARPGGPDTVLVTSGGHAGLVEALRHLTAAGDVVLTEAHTYPGLVDIAGAASLRLLGLPGDGDGSTRPGWHGHCGGSGSGRWRCSRGSRTRPVAGPRPAGWPSWRRSSTGRASRWWRMRCWPTSIPTVGRRRWQDTAASPGW